MSPRRNVFLSLILGILMFLFGFLKFFEPARGWFAVQIAQSHLPPLSIPAGKVTEMLTGVLFLLPVVWRSLPGRRKDQLVLAAAFLLTTQMFVAIYVHLQPAVPASVLPLGIKPPFIPVTVLLLGWFTAFGAWRDLAAQKAAGSPVR